ncbi:hypothetical protein BWD42_07730 [Sphingobacterium sp. CZ-UAM]|uniref:alginate lyase family protein n=1 Tax=Sphingobacterium sp. CZ-UAM TaxID=1933868 RepID=UPI000984E14F|nr:alginate lyase family protein [Sphingobacterium sp. CZ-UAM]OOG19780.1 hypothetical protein BWD42_07730 [Sphingobacterium sp. CZ-UAM]
MINKISCIYTLAAGCLMAMTGCQKKDLNSDGLNLNAKMAQTQGTVFARNLLFDEPGLQQIQADLINPATKTKVSAFIEPAATKALSYTPVGHRSVYDVPAAVTAAKESSEYLRAIGIKLMLTKDSLIRQPYVAKASAILKAWAKVNVQSWHRPAETNLMSMYESYSMIRSFMTKTDRDTVDGWIRRRATVGSFKFIDQDGNEVNKHNNWEGQRLCFLLYSGYILNDNTLISRAKSEYKIFLNNYLLADGRTADTKDRDAFAYHSYGLVYTAKILHAIYTMEGVQARDLSKEIVNTNGKKLVDAIRYWEPYLSGLYHMEFKKSIFESERTGPRVGTYDPKSSLYALDEIVQSFSELFPYFELLEGTPSDRFNNVVRYISLLNSPNIANTPSFGNIVHFYKDYNYGTTVGSLKLGGYDNAKLISLGIKDNDISSFKVPDNLKVLLFDGNFRDSVNVEGTQKVFITNQPNLGTAGFNDKTSSIIITNR